MKVTLFIISTVGLALANPIIPTMVSSLAPIATTTDDPLSIPLMPTVLKTPPPVATPTEEPTPTKLPEWLLPEHPICNGILPCFDERLEFVRPNPCKEAPDRYFEFCAGVAKLEAWKEKWGM